ncbi:response regulator transcription factor [Erythrobacter sp. F6033]|uniref:response regulator transcription factor n=1 Tax=Erythrobacter sp. F6033 TaxID=2926401 RepID=UPI001FF1E0D6|nr:response regulator transcription factor [Erythrobacter sp. F6033]MCK0127646.1 response regulator transcription factor [Erythrobacter sp. F6033]
MRIALADDEQDILDQVSFVVKNAGHDVNCFSDGISILNALKRETFDVVMLDWNMPGMTGLEVLEWATENLDAPPAFILLTSRQDKGDVVSGLEAGAVDYVVKPESDEVIRARIEAAGRRASSPEHKRHDWYGAYEIDRLEKSIKREDEVIQLTAKEFDLADLFFQNLDRPLSRGYLFSRVWGGHAEIETRTIDMHVSRLRSKLKLSPENGFVIRTVFGFGYRMDQYAEE